MPDGNWSSYSPDRHDGEGDCEVNYHGPRVAAPGYPYSYLDVFAGPIARRPMVFCDDPTHHGVLDSRRGVATDPRLPMALVAGPVRSAG